jgi:hypothetical protein
VRITNECPLPCAPGQLDLSQEAFAELADLKASRIPITWQLLSPGTSDTISLSYKSGSSPYWCGIQAIGHRNPVAHLEVKTGDGWRRLPCTEYNYFLSADGSGCGSSIRITDIYGERLAITGIALRPDVVQATRVQFAPALTRDPAGQADRAGSPSPPADRPVTAAGGHRPRRADRPRRAEGALDLRAVVEAHRRWLWRQQTINDVKREHSSSRGPCSSRNTSINFIWK